MKNEFGLGTAGLAQRIGTKIEKYEKLNILKKVDLPICQVNQFTRS